MTAKIEDLGNLERGLDHQVNLAKARHEAVEHLRAAIQCCNAADLGALTNQDGAFGFVAQALEAAGDREGFDDWCRNGEWTENPFSDELQTAKRLRWQTVEKLRALEAREAERREQREAERKRAARARVKRFVAENPGVELNDSDAEIEIYTAGARLSAQECHLRISPYERAERGSKASAWLDIAEFIDELEPCEPGCPCGFDG